MNSREHRPFSGIKFDRLAERRNDAEWLRHLDPERVKILPIWRGRVLVEIENELPRMARVQPESLASPIAFDELIMLGEFHEHIYFAKGIDGDIAPVLHASTQFHDLRSISGLLNHDELGMLGYARALIHWRNAHRHCGHCGSLNNSTQGGHVMVCSNASCKQQTFPRLDPAVIVLITDGERVLLGRQSRFPPGRYSTIAGFVEWAESIEEAVIREAREETGVVVDEVHYHSSQPWPFPSSLMLGFEAHAITSEITLNDKELEDARWFTRDDIANGAIHLPPTQSISFSLIEHWYNRDASRPLQQEPRAVIDNPEQLFKQACQ